MYALRVQIRQSGFFNILLIMVFWKHVGIEAAPVLMDRRLNVVSEDGEKMQSGRLRASEGSKRR